MDLQQQVTSSNGDLKRGDDALGLSVLVTDPEVIAELARHPEGAAREQYALSALRLGVLALRQASGSIDAARIRSESERLVADVRTLMSDEATALTNKLNGAMVQYFDPQTGDLPQRLDRLVRKDGDIDMVLRRHLDGEASSMARTLVDYVGATSPIFKHLSSEQSDGFLAMLQQAIDESLHTTRDHILQQFSLDDKTSALSRLVTEITDSNGRLCADLEADIEMVRKEFSLDEPEGALSRLVKRVDDTTAQVRGSLTLDNEASPLAVLRRELLGVIQNLNDANVAFHGEVRRTLEVLQARRTEAAQSTRHGLEFEDAVGEILTQQTHNSGDILECVSQSAGRISRCKVGDFVLTLGPESVASGACIVLEAKEDRSYDLRRMIDELAQARENRAAQVGIAVLSKATVPEGIDPLTRIGSDIIVVWDRDDTASDVLFAAALSLARALVVRERSQQERVQAEFTTIEDGVRRIAKAAESLDEIMTFSETIRSNGTKIRERAERLRDEIDKQLAVVRQNVDGLKQYAGDEAAAA